MKYVQNITKYMGLNPFVILTWLRLHYQLYMSISVHKKLLFFINMEMIFMASALIYISVWLTFRNIHNFCLVKLLHFLKLIIISLLYAEKQKFQNFKHQNHSYVDDLCFILISIPSM